MAVVVTPPRRRARTRGELREAEILDAVERLLARRGFEELTMEELAEEVGITRPSLYFYFDSRQAVAVALVRRTMRALTAPARRDGRPPGEETIQRSLEHVASLWRGHAAVMLFAARNADAIPAVGELWEEALATWRSEAERSLLAIGVPAAKSGGTAAALVAMVERSFQALHSRHYTRSEERALVQTLADACLAVGRGVR